MIPYYLFTKKAYTYLNTHGHKQSKCLRIEDYKSQAFRLVLGDKPCVDKTFTRTNFPLDQRAVQEGT